MMEDYEPRYLNRVKIFGQRYKDWLILCDDCLEKMQDEGQDARNYGMVIGDYSCERCGKKD